MKRFVRISVLLVLVLAPLGATFGSLSKTYTFSTSDLYIDTVEVDGINYHQISLEDCYNYAECLGDPSLPVMDVRFIIPFDEEVEYVEVSSLDSTTVLDNARPMPHQPPKIGIESAPFIPESDYYYVAQLPGIAASVEHHGVSAESHVVSIRLFPVQFNPQSGELKLYTSVQIQLHTETCSPRTMVVYRDSLAKVDKINLWESRVENPEDVEGYLQETWDKYMLPLGEDEPKENMAIITVAQFADEFQRLAEWKTQRGCSTGVHIIPEIGIGTSSSYYSAFVLEKIRELAEDGCWYILLGGGYGVIPTRDNCHWWLNCNMGMGTGGAPYTDLYYADCSYGEGDASENVFQAWDENGNGLFAEPYCKGDFSVNCLGFYDNQRGYMVAATESEQHVLKTTDGGVTWNPCSSFEYGITHDIRAVSSNKVIVCGSFGIVFSQDNGKTWDLVYEFPEGDLSTVWDMDFVDANNGWAVGYKKDAEGNNIYLFLATSDGGESWVEKSITPDDGILKTIDAVSTSRLWIAGPNGVFRVDISGEDYTFTPDSPSGYGQLKYSNCAFCDGNRGIVYATSIDQYDRYVFRRDASGTWHESTPEPIHTWGVWNAIATNDPPGRILFFDPNGNYAYCSDDYGMTWEDISTSADWPFRGKADFFTKSGEVYIWNAGYDQGIDHTYMIRTIDGDNPNIQSIPWQSLSYDEIVFGDIGGSVNSEWYPDVSIGRLPVKTLEEAKLLIDKIIAYEKTPPEENYADRALFLANYMWGDEIPQAKTRADLWENKCGNGTAYELYQPLSGGDDELNRSNARNALNLGYNFVYHIDHGGYWGGKGGYIGAGTEAGGDQVLFAGEDFAALTNGEKQSILITGSCWSANYHEWNNRGENVAVEFLCNSKGGGLAYIGSVYPSFNDNVNPTQNEFVSQLCQSDPPPLGDMYLASMGGFYSTENFHLLGDPSLQMWNNTLIHFADQVGWEITHTGKLCITVWDDQDAPVEGALVCLYMTDQYYEKSMTNFRGKALFDEHPPDGVICITVTKQNYIPYQEWRILGDQCNDPIPVNYQWATRSTNSRNVAVDVNGNLHLVYTDLEGEDYVAKYAVSCDTGKTWSIKEIDPDETNDTRFPTLDLRNGLYPYAAYLVYHWNPPNAWWTCKIANLSTGERIELNDHGSFRIGPGFSIGIPDEGHLILREPNKLRYVKLDLDEVDKSSLKAVVEQRERILEDCDPYATPLPYGPAIDVCTYSPSAGGGGSQVFNWPIVVFDVWKNEGGANPTPYCYYWYPLNETYPEPALLSDESRKNPTVAANFRQIAAGYPSIYVKQWGLSLSDPPSVPEEEDYIPVNASDLQVFHASPCAMVWTHPTEGVKFTTQKNGQWVQSVFQSQIYRNVYYPSADVNLQSKIGACSWTESDGSNYWVRTEAAEMPNMGGGAGLDNVIVTSPKTGDIWPDGFSRTISWIQNEDADEVTLKVSWNGGQSYSVIDDEVGPKESGSHSYQWEVGTLKNGRIPTPPWNGTPEIFWDDCFIKVVCDSDFGKSGRFKIQYGLDEIDPTIPPQATAVKPDRNCGPHHGYQAPGDSNSTGWRFITPFGCSQVDLLISTDNGESFDFLYYGSLPTDSLIYDTLIYSEDTFVRKLYIGTIDWEVPNTPCSYNSGRLKLIGWNGNQDSISCTFGEFTIPLPDCHERSTAADQMIMAPGTAAGAVGIVYTTKVSDSSASIVRYTETTNGLSFSPPDSLGIGILPAHSYGNVAWLSENRDSVLYSYWEPSISGFALSDAIAHSSQGGGGQGSIEFAPVGIASEGDTVYMAVLKRIYFGGNTQYIIELRSFLKDSPQFFSADTFIFPQQPGLDSTEFSAPSIVVSDSRWHIAFAHRDSCLYFTDELGPSFIQVPGIGTYPSVAVYEGNVAYSYLSADLSKLIRLWRFRDDTAWVSADTFVLKDTIECVTAAAGLLYGLQTKDEAKAQVCLYGPMSEAFYPQENLTGYNLHALHIPGEAEKWYLGFTQHDYDFNFLSTRVENIRTLYPALYLKSTLLRSPYTIHRDTVSEIDGELVDYGQNNLIYGFNRLDPSTDYSLLLEFLCEADTPTVVSVNLNNHLDTLVLPSEGTYWYESEVSDTNTFSLILTRLSGYAITLKRMIIRHRDDAGYVMGTPGGAVSEKLNPLSLCLFQPFPNPFDDAATIRYSLPHATHVSLKVYDVSGRQVANLVDNEQMPGIHALRWEGKDQLNRKCPSGIYFVQFKTDQYQASKKMVLIK